MVSVSYMPPAQLTGIFLKMVEVRWHTKEKSSMERYYLFVVGFSTFSIQIIWNYIKI